MIKEKKLCDYVRINEICTLIKGQTPIMKAIPGKFPLVVTAEKRKSCNKYEIDDEAICIPLVSSTGHGHASINRIHYQDGKFALANIMVAIISKNKNKSFPKYMYHLFNTNKEDYFVSLMAGTANVSLKIKDIEKIVIPLPSLNEQKTIVSKIEELLCRFNDTKTILEKTNLQIQQFKESFLEFMLSGELTDSWRDENKDKIKPISLQTPTISLSELKNLPNGWKYIRIQDLTNNPKQDIVDGPFGSNLKTTEYVDEGIPLIRIQNVDRNNFINKNIIYITKEKASQLKRHNFIANDIVIAKLGDPVGKACIVPPFLKEGIIVADIIRLRINEEFILKKFLTYMINSNIVIQQFYENTTGSTRQRVNLTKVRDFIIPLPSILEQKEIVSKIDQCFSLIENAENITNLMLNQLEKLRLTVLKQTFVF